jgi:hypothetical protein
MSSSQSQSQSQEDCFIVKGCFGLIEFWDSIPLLVHILEHYEKEPITSIHLELVKSFKIQHLSGNSLKSTYHLGEVSKECLEWNSMILKSFPSWFGSLAGLQFSSSSSSSSFSSPVIHPETGFLQWNIETSQFYSLAYLSEFLHCDVILKKVLPLAFLPRLFYTSPEKCLFHHSDPFQSSSKSSSSISIEPEYQSQVELQVCHSGAGSIDEPELPRTTKSSSSVSSSSCDTYIQSLLEIADNSQVIHRYYLLKELRMNYPLRTEYSFHHPIKVYYFIKNKLPNSIPSVYHPQEFRRNVPITRRRYSQDARDEEMKKLEMEEYHKIVVVEDYETLNAIYNNIHPMERDTSFEYYTSFRMTDPPISISTSSSTSTVVSSESTLIDMYTPEEFQETLPSSLLTHSFYSFTMDEIHSYTFSKKIVSYFLIMKELLELDTD